jgi:hypothetical protein
MDHRDVVMPCWFQFVADFVRYAIAFVVDVGFDEARSVGFACDRVNTECGDIGEFVFGGYTIDISPDVAINTFGFKVDVIPKMVVGF